MDIKEWGDNLIQSINGSSNNNQNDSLEIKEYINKN